MTIKTFEEACEALNLSTELPAFPALTEQEAKAQIAHYKLCIIAKALNGDWTPDWTNSDEYKYFPWFDMDPETFSLNDVTDRYYCSDVSSRLCFKSEALAEYAATEFIELYKDYYLIA